MTEIPQTHYANSGGMYIGYQVLGQGAHVSADVLPSANTRPK